MSEENVILDGARVRAGARCILKRALRVAGQVVFPDDSWDGLAIRWAGLLKVAPAVALAPVYRAFERAARAWDEGNNSGSPAGLRRGEIACEQARAEAEHVLRVILGIRCTYPGLYPVFALSDGSEEHDLDQAARRACELNPY